MGSGSSVPLDSVPKLVTKETAKELLGKAYDDERFEQESTFNEELAQAVVGKARFLELAGTATGESGVDDLEAWLAQAAGLTEKKIAKALAICDKQDIEDVGDLRMLYEKGKLSGVGFSDIITEKIVEAIEQGNSTVEIATASSVSNAEKSLSHGSATHSKASKDLAAPPRHVQTLLQDASLGQIADCQSRP